MLSERERQASEQAQKKAQRWNIANTVLAGAAILFSIGMSQWSVRISTLSSAASSLQGAGTAQTSVCLDWASYVLDQQDPAKWDPGTTSETIDTRIDMVGEVLYSRVHAQFMSESESLKWQAKDEKNGASPAPLTDNQTIPRVGLGDYCGSANEIRTARELDDDFDLHFNHHQSPG